MERAFRLAGLLRLRKLQEDQAAALLARSNAGLRASEARRDKRATALARHRLPDGDRRAFAAGVAGRASLGGLLVEARSVVVGAREQVAVHTDAWSRARSASVGLEKLQDKHDVVVAREDNRLEQNTLDEIAARSGAGAGRPGDGSAGAGRRGDGPAGPAAPNPRRVR